MSGALGSSLLSNDEPISWRSGTLRLTKAEIVYTWLGLISLSVASFAAYSQGGAEGESFRRLILDASSHSFETASESKRAKILFSISGGIQKAKLAPFRTLVYSKHPAEDPKSLTCPGHTSFVTHDPMLFQPYTPAL